MGVTPGADENGDPAITLDEDVVLHKCYRNPLEVLVCAHALGFGIYGKKIVQMLENEERKEAGERQDNAEERVNEEQKQRPENE